MKEEKNARTRDAAIGLIFVLIGVASGVLFILHGLQLSISAWNWISEGDWLSLLKRILTTFLFGAVALKATAAGKAKYWG